MPRSPCYVDGRNRLSLVWLASGRGSRTASANFAGVIGPALTGLVVDNPGSFLAPFTITVALLILGAIVWVYVVGALEQVDWTAPTARSLGRGRRLRCRC